MVVPTWPPASSIKETFFNWLGNVARSYACKVDLEVKEFDLDRSPAA